MHSTALLRCALKTNVCVCVCLHICLCTCVCLFQGLGPSPLGSGAGSGASTAGGAATIVMDHASPFVEADCKGWMLWLQEEYGFSVRAIQTALYLCRTRSVQFFYLHVLCIVLTVCVHCTES